MSTLFFKTNCIIKTGKHVTTKMDVQNVTNMHLKIKIIYPF